MGGVAYSKPGSAWQPWLLALRVCLLADVGYRLARET